MTTCICTDRYYPAIGGIPQYYKYLAELLTLAGHRVVILTIDESGDKKPDKIEHRESVTIVTLVASYAKHVSLYQPYFRPGSYTAYKWIAMGYAMKEWLLENHLSYNIDIIETADFGGAAVFLVEDSLPPVIVIGHSSSIQISRYSYMKDDDHLKVIQQLEALSFKYCDAIVAHSPMNQQDLSRITERQVHFARAPWIKPQKKQVPLAGTGIGHVVVSSLQMIKGAELMAKAIRLAIKKDSSLKIHWIGGDTCTAPHAEKMSSFLARDYADIWNKHFIWLGEKDHQDVLDIISEASTAIIPSLWETFNYFALESLFFEKPLILTENTGISYLLKDKGDILIIPASPEKLSEAIMDLRLPEKKGIESNKESILSYFSPATILEDRIELYKYCLANRKPNGKVAANALAFINKYTTPMRKYYYLARKKLKKIIKPKD